MANDSTQGMDLGCHGGRSRKYDDSSLTRPAVCLIPVANINPVEVFGYGIRIASTNDTSKKPPFVAQYVLIVLSPVLMTGIIYVAFGRIVFHVIPAAQRSTKLLWVSRK